MDIGDFNDWFRTLNRFSGVPGVLYFLLFMRNWRALSGIIFTLVFISFFADNANYFFIRFVYPNSYIIGGTWHLMHFFIAMVLFYQVLIDHRKLIILFSGIYSALVLCSLLFLDYTFLDANPFISVPNNLIFVILCLITYRAMLLVPENKGKLRNSPLYWFVTAHFIYCTLTIFYYLFRQYLIFDLKIDAFDFNYISVINQAANITKNFITLYVLVLIDKGHQILPLAQRSND